MDRLLARLTGPEGPGETNGDRDEKVPSGFGISRPSVVHD